MAFCKCSHVLAAMGLLVLQAACMVLAVNPPPVMDFVPPPNGECPASCLLRQNQVNSSFFTFRNADNARPGEDGPGGKIIPIHVAQFPALRMLSSSYTILKINPCGLSPPHVHPRGTELQYVIEGTMLIGFIDTMMKLRLSVLHPGDIFVVPQGMVHFTQSIDEKGFKSVAAFNSEEAGTIFVYSAVLETPDGIIEATTGLDESGVAQLRSLADFAKRRPTVNRQCLKDIKAGRTFDFMKGASMLAGERYVYGK